MTALRPLRSGEPRRLGDYRLTGALGSGGQGTVYQGEGADGRKVAVKLLHTRLTHDPKAHRRFLAEAEAARRVAVFCTASVLDVGVYDDQPYLVSEFVEGLTLYDLVKTSGPRTGGGLDRLAIATLTALAAIHRAGIVHRDFKPGNVLMGQEGPVVIDFGIAKALDATGTATSATLGTPAYMSPEQVAGEHTGPASDVFSWAGTMVFAATGHPAFTAGTVPALMHSVTKGEPDLSGLPQEWVAPITACLAKDPAERPTPTDLLDRLTGAKPASEAKVRQASEPGVRSEGAPTEPGARRPVSRRALILGTAAAAVAGASALAVLRPKDGRATPIPTPTATTNVTPTPTPTPTPTYAFGDAIGELITVAPKDHGPFHLALAGDHAIVGSRKGAVSVWELATGKLVRRLVKSGPAVTALATGPDRTLASGHGDGRIRLWNLDTGEETAHHRLSAPVFRLRLEGKAVAVSQKYDGMTDYYGTVRFWNPVTGKPIGPANSIHWQGADDAAFGTLHNTGVAITGDGRENLRVWNLSTGAVMKTFGTGEIGGIERVAHAVVGGKDVAVTTHLDASLRVYDLASGKRKHRWSFSDRSPDDRGVSAMVTGELNGVPVAVVAHDKLVGVRVWNLTDGSAVGTVTGFSARVTDVRMGALGTMPIVAAVTDDGTLDVRSLA